MDSEIAREIIGHYQKTCEMTSEMSRERNQTFLFLLGTIAIATLLISNIPEFDSLLDIIIARISNSSDKKMIEQLQSTLQFGILQTILLMVVFYLMVNLYNRNYFVLKNYQYLGKLEKEIRQYLGLGDESVAFGREGTYYWKKRSWFLGSVKYFYTALLGVLLLVFLGVRVGLDFKSGICFQGVIDALIAISILFYFVAYTKSSLSLDSERR